MGGGTQKHTQEQQQNTLPHFTLEEGEGGKEGERGGCGGEMWVLVEVLLC